MIAALLLMTSCATVPKHNHDEEAQRFKEGSVLHGYGAALVLIGVSTLAAGTAVAAVSEEGRVVGASWAGVGLVELLAGGYLVKKGNEKFTPISEEEQKAQEEIDRQLKGRRPGRR